MLSQQVALDYGPTRSAAMPYARRNKTEMIEQALAPSKRNSDRPGRRVFVSHVHVPLRRMAPREVTGSAVPGER